MLNWVWYCDYADNSQMLDDVMTDNEGHRHHKTVLAGKVRSELWETQKAHATSTLPTPLATLVANTEEPFVQRILNTSQAPQASYFRGKVLIVGDAFSHFRPHVAESTNQAALNALLLGQSLRGGISHTERDVKCMDFSTVTRAKSIFWGELNQHGKLAALKPALVLLGSLMSVWVRSRFRALLKVISPRTSTAKLD